MYSGKRKQYCQPRKLVSNNMIQNYRNIRKNTLIDVYDGYSRIMWWIVKLVLQAQKQQIMTESRIIDRVPYSFVMLFTKVKIA